MQYYGLTYTALMAMSKQALSDLCDASSADVKRGWMDGGHDALHDDCCDMVPPGNDELSEKALKKKIAEGTHNDEYLKGYWIGQVTFG